MTKTEWFIHKINDELILKIEGNSYGGHHGTMEYPPEPPEFEYTKIEIIKGNVTMLIDYIDSDVKEPIGMWIERLFFNQEN